MVKTYKMKDKSDNFTIKKSNGVFSLPARILGIGKTGCGKSSICLGNFLLLPEFYRNDFLPENIFIFSGSLHGDLKLQTIIEQLEIPSENCFDNFDEDIGHTIYDMIVDNFNEAIENNTRPDHTIIIFDDLGFTNRMNKNKKDSILDKLVSNGRKYCCSTLCLGQRITQFSSNIREQASGIVLFKASKKQKELIEADFNYLPSKKQFMDMLTCHTEGKNDYMVIDLNDPNEHIYKDKNFKKICTCPDKLKKCGGV
jgi:hypothetical protein